MQPTSHCDEKNIQLVSLASFVLFLLIFVDFGEFGTILVICDEIFSIHGVFELIPYKTNR